MDSGSLQGNREFHNELAVKIAAMPPSADCSSVVPPLGLCCSEPRPPFRWWWHRIKGNDDEDDQDLDDHHCRRRLPLVYDLMYNDNLQDTLLDRRCPELADEEEVVVEINLEESKSPKNRMKNPPTVAEDDIESTPTVGIGILVEEEEEGIIGIVETRKGRGMVPSGGSGSGIHFGGGKRGFDRMSVDSGSRGRHRAEEKCQLAVGEGLVVAAGCLWALERTEEGRRGSDKERGGGRDESPDSDEGRG